MVYKWFLVVYKVSYGLGILGYVLMMATFLGLYILFAVKPQVFMDAGILMMFYALYYGVMARDFAEICTEKMVSRIGVSQDVQDRSAEGVGRGGARGGPTCGDGAGCAGPSCAGA